VNSHRELINSFRHQSAIVVPAYNEEQSLGRLLDEIKTCLPGFRVIVVNDGSVDNTSAVARQHGALVLELPCNLGVGGAMQAGFRYAYDLGCRYLIRIDADGQHPPAEIPKLMAEMSRGLSDLVIGSRFGGQNVCISTGFRYVGIRALALFISMICRSRVLDPTSGFWMLNRRLLYYFAHDYPDDYPEPEALALLRRQGYSFKEVPVTFRPRTAGVSSIRAWGTFYYAVKVGLALFVDRVRPIDQRFARANVKES
jgi:hypothetical protein